MTGYEGQVNFKNLSSNGYRWSIKNLGQLRLRNNIETRFTLRQRLEVFESEDGFMLSDQKKSKFFSLEKDEIYEHVTRDSHQLLSITLRIADD